MFKIQDFGPKIKMKKELYNIEPDHFMCVFSIISQIAHE